MSGTSTTSPRPALAAPAHALCLGCNYALCELAEPRCPECGRRFDPAVPDTMNLSGRPVGPIARALLRPVGWPTYLAAVVALLWPVWEARRPGSWTAPILAILLWLLILAWHVARYIVRAIVASLYGRPGDELFAGGWRWLVTPALLVVWAVLPLGSVRRVAFSIGRPAFEQLAAEALANPTRLPTARSAGVLVARVEAIHHGGVHIFTGLGYDGAHCGYAFFPEGTSPPPPPDGAQSPPYILYYPVADRWYEYFGHGVLGKAGAATAPTTAPGNTGLAPPRRPATGAAVPSTSGG